MQDPAQVARGLAEIAALLRLGGERKFRVKAYEHAAEVVNTLGPELGTSIERDQLRKLQGIGAALTSQIHELWNTGSSELLRRLRSQFPEGASELMQVSGMTARRIRLLHDELAIGSVEDLRAACRAGRIRDLPGFGPKTEQKLLEASERWQPSVSSLPRRWPLARALEIAGRIKEELREVVSSVELAGALRRGEEAVDELEFVVAGDTSTALQHLRNQGSVLRTDLASSSAQLSASLRLKLHSADRDWGNALVWATGNCAHVRGVEERAAALGLNLAPSTDQRHSLEPSALSRRSFPSEPDLYRALGLAYVPPELREGRGELEQAATRDFEDLIRIDDIRGLVHCHTDYSDGKNTIFEMARAAHALGMQYITITDHSPSAHYARGVALDRLAQQWDEIDAARERVPIAILRGTESDILQDGSLDFPDSILEQFDVVIASIHARHRMDRRAMTERLVRAMSLPMFKIWGHALGRIIEHRPPIDCDVEAVLEALAHSRGAVEINADPFRLDLPPAWIPVARACRLPFVISVDAHSTSGFGVLQYGVTMARRGGVARDEVLNTRSPDEFVALVRPI